MNTRSPRKWSGVRRRCRRSFAETKQSENPTHHIPTVCSERTRHRTLRGVLCSECGSWATWVPLLHSPAAGARDRPEGRQLLSRGHTCTVATIAACPRRCQRRRAVGRREAERRTTRADTTTRAATDIVQRTTCNGQQTTRSMQHAHAPAGRHESRSAAQARTDENRPPAPLCAIDQSTMRSAC